MEREFDIYELMEPEHLPCSEPEEPSCECYFSGDRADASDCELHHPGSAWNQRRNAVIAAWDALHAGRKPMGRTDSLVWDSGREVA